MKSPRAPKQQAHFRTLIRLLALASFIILVNIGVDFLLDMVKSPASDRVQNAITGAIILGLLLYTILMAIPFVPGVEIGISLLMMQGAAVAPYVFLATFTGLTISFMIGRYLPYSYLHRIFADLGLSKACVLLERLQPLDQNQRLDLLRQRLPGWLGPVAVKYRYVTVAAALNIPGNFIIGGGGGIALIAGLSRVFSPLATLVTFALAVAPVALAVYIFGVDMFSF